MPIEDGMLPMPETGVYPMAVPVMAEKPPDDKPMDEGMEVPTPTIAALPMGEAGMVPIAMPLIAVRLPVEAFIPMALPEVMV
jgi:hypothetical protein